MYIYLHVYMRYMRVCFMVLEPFLLHLITNHPKYLVDFNPYKVVPASCLSTIDAYWGKNVTNKKKNIFSEWTWKPCDIHLVTNTFVPWSSQVSWSPLVIPFGNPFELSFLTVQEVATTKITRPWWDHHDLAGYSSGKLAGWPTPLKIMVYCLMGLMIVIQWDINGIYPLESCYSLRTWKIAWWIFP